MIIPDAIRRIETGRVEDYPTRPPWNDRFPDTRLIEPCTLIVRIHPPAQSERIVTKEVDVVPAFQHRVVFPPACCPGVIPDASPDGEVILGRERAAPILLVAVKSRADSYDVIFVGREGTVDFGKESVAVVLLNVRDDNVPAAAEEIVRAVAKMKIDVKHERG